MSSIANGMKKLVRFHPSEKSKSTILYAIIKIINEPLRIMPSEKIIDTSITNKMLFLK